MTELELLQAIEKRIGRVMTIAEADDVLEFVETPECSVTPHGEPSIACIVEELFT